MKETIGATEKEGKFYCDKCGADLSIEGSVTATAHADGKKFYCWIYECNKCGNSITQRFSRKGEL